MFKHIDLVMQSLNIFCALCLFASTVGGALYVAFLLDVLVSGIIFRLQIGAFSLSLLFMFGQALLQCTNKLTVTFSLLSSCFLIVSQSSEFGFQQAMQLK